MQMHAADAVANITVTVVTSYQYIHSIYKNLTVVYFLCEFGTTAIRIYQFINTSIISRNHMLNFRCPQYVLD